MYAKKRAAIGSLCSVVTQNHPPQLAGHLQSGWEIR